MSVRENKITTMKKAIAIICIWTAALSLPHLIGFSFTILTGGRIDAFFGGLMLMLASLGAALGSIHVLNEFE